MGSIRLQIFQRSFSTKGAGRGLGTYSVKLLSERYLKGAVGFRSTHAEGTRFFARYPKRLQAKITLRSPADRTDCRPAGKARSSEWGSAAV